MSTHCDVHLVLASCAMPKIPQIIVVIDDPLTAEQHNDLGVAYEQKGELRPRREGIRKSDQEEQGLGDPLPEPRAPLLPAGQLDQAERTLRGGLRVKGDHPDLLNNLAWVLMEKGQLKDAKTLIDKAIAIEDKEEYRDTRQEILNRINEK